jgi:hypothetical protein
VIEAWWKRISGSLTEKRHIKRQNHAAVVIQRNYRGYGLRKLLRPELRLKLRRLGELMNKNRALLLRLKGAYVLQVAWREYSKKKILRDKEKLQNIAITKIIALWRGYWVRSHLHLHYDYAGTVFLSAVRRALKKSKFTLRIYKPTGIVCPK